MGTFDCCRCRPKREGTFGGGSRKRYGSSGPGQSPKTNAPYGVRSIAIAPILPIAAARPFPIRPIPFLHFALRLLATTESLLSSSSTLCYAVVSPSFSPSPLPLVEAVGPSFALTLSVVVPVALESPTLFSSFLQSPPFIVIHSRRPCWRPSICAVHSFFCTALSLYSHGICKTPIVSGFATVVFTCGAAHCDAFLLAGPVAGSVSTPNFAKHLTHTPASLSLWPFLAPSLLKTFCFLLLRGPIHVLSAKPKTQRSLCFSAHHDYCFWCETQC
jgi:hypothetical protein